MRKLAIVAMLAVVVFAGRAYGFPDLINGGFEDGDFTGWTVSGDANITNVGFDVRTNNQLATVAYGDHSARVGDEYAWGFDPNNEPFESTVSQSETVGTSDLQTLYFAWAAVGLVPDNGVDHTEEQTPYFRVAINWYHDGGTLTTLFTEDHYTGPIGSITPGWLEGASDTGNEYGQNEAGIWYFRPWNVFSFDLSTYGIQVGDQLEVVLTARDCTLGGHSSYAYLDGFGTEPPPPPPTVPEPSTFALLGLGSLGLLTGGFVRRRAKNS